MRLQWLPSLSHQRELKLSSDKQMTLPHDFSTLIECHQSYDSWGERERKRGRKGGREGEKGRKRGREGGRKGGRKREREREREGERKRGRERGREKETCTHL